MSTRLADLTARVYTKTHLKSSELFFFFWQTKLPYQSVLDDTIRKVATFGANMSICQ